MRFLPKLPKPAHVRRPGRATFSCPRCGGHRFVLCDLGGVRELTCTGQWDVERGARGPCTYREIGSQDWANSTLDDLRDLPRSRLLKRFALAYTALRKYGGGTIGLIVGADHFELMIQLTGEGPTWRIEHRMRHYARRPQDTHERLAEAVAFLELELGALGGVTIRRLCDTRPQLMAIAARARLPVHAAPGVH